MLVKCVKISESQIRKFHKIYHVCASSKLQDIVSKKNYKILGKRVGDYVSCDIAVFVNWPSRQRFKCFQTYLVLFHERKE